MKKEKLATLRAVRAVEVKRPGAVSTAPERHDSPASRCLCARQGVAIAKTLLVAALAIIASSPALAGKGGIPGAPGAPDVNLGLQIAQSMGVGVPRLGGASALTPAGGSLPPGQLPTPGLGLGRTGTIGAPQVTPGMAPSAQGVVPSSPALKRGPNAAPSSSTDDAGRVVSRVNGPDAASVSNSNPLRRQIPVCR